jgi:hypothetical protein
MARFRHKYLEGTVHHTLSKQKMPKSSYLPVVFFALAAFVQPQFTRGAVTLYDQNFESPVGFVNDGGDVNIFRTVNQLYGNQPPGFTFAQDFTVETLLVTGTQAFGTGYSDPTGQAGNYALGMLQSVQNDRLGLSFNVGSFKFLNFGLDISSIDLSTFGGPFVAPGAIPIFQFTLFDNPTGATGLTGNGTILDQQSATGTASAQNVFDWTEVVLALDATGNTNGNVTLQIDLLQGGYAGMDNFRIVASDVAGDLGQVPEPSSLAILGIGSCLAGFGAIRRRLQASRAA